MHGAHAAEWDSLETLRRDETLGGSTKWAFAWLWHEAGGKPGHLVVHMRSLGADFGASPRAADKWLKQLVQAGLIEIIEEDRRRGTKEIYLFNPNPSERQPRPDPQGRLPFNSPNESESVGPLGAQRSDQTQKTEPKQPNRARPPAQRSDQIGPVGPLGAQRSDQTHSISAPAPARPVDVDADLKFWSTVDVDRASVSYDELVGHVHDLVRRLGVSPLDKRDWSLLFKAAWLAQQKFAPNWLTSAVTGTVLAKAGKPIAYLTQSLAAAIWDHDNFQPDSRDPGVKREILQRCFRPVFRQLPEPGRAHIEAAQRGPLGAPAVPAAKRENLAEPEPLRNLVELFAEATADDEPRPKARSP